MKKLLFAAFLLMCSISVVNAQDKEEKDSKGNIYVKVKDGKKPVIFIDGKKFDFPMELIDQTKIASINVIKGKEAIKKYSAPNGVILITTKASKILDFSGVKIRKNGDLKEDKPAPMIIIDGKVVDLKSLETLKPEKIEKMEIFKDKKAMEKYKAPNGVIVITTKKM
ncbi:hypothetical protein BW723_06120 [Polaribacter reichenbachii]|uniref:TonB-dependent receptor plug domain-containing protein n=1 Tax=Polaribacter reichenbachii TaxID=996801 RepID=A0A1B8TYM0_9FLAO|nr:hypothetical protein [Polaribacter reichenbachii]APZ45895.1 hypothetical protein BW723_06120 [Polaribacter reichenbachii]AUC19757.1 hypothetical protein BTO17_14135 [Polaribacter reichenbachii]OBY64674.1 hypothetical protein LPB301_09600 [Polaribacter reichenbachii]